MITTGVGAPMGTYMSPPAPRAGLGGQSHMRLVKLLQSVLECCDFHGSRWYRTPENPDPSLPKIGQNPAGFGREVSQKSDISRPNGAISAKMYPGKSDKSWVSGSMSVEKIGHYV